MASNPTLRARLERVGMGSIHPVQGLTALAMALHHLNSIGHSCLGYTCEKGLSHTLLSVARLLDKDNTLQLLGIKL